MHLTIELPEDVAQNLRGSNGVNLSHSVLEMIALEGYRAGSLTHAQVRRLLGFGNRLDVDAFLKKHEVWLPYTIEDFEADLETHQKLGL